MSRISLAVLALFTLLEVLLFGGSAGIILAVTIAEYAFILWITTYDFGLAAAYLISFSLLSMGAWTYISGSPPPTFWGLRVGGLSVNAMFTFGLAGFGLISGTARPRRYMGPVHYFLIGLLLYSTVLGVLSASWGLVYWQDFLHDGMVYVPYLPYAILLPAVRPRALYAIVRYGLPLTVASMLLSLAVGHEFQYAAGLHYVLMNGFAYVVVCMVAFTRRYVSTAEYVALIIAVALLLLSGAEFIGAKTILGIVAAFVWGATRTPRRAWVFGAAAIAMVAAIGPATRFLQHQFPENSLPNYKFGQVVDLTGSGGISALSAQDTSAGNIAAEGLTIYGFLRRHWIMAVFGRGFGAGVPDIYGDLSPLAGAGAGYDAGDVGRGEFVRMHLPVFEIVLKAGAIGLIAYFLVLAWLAKMKNVFSFGALFVLASAFTNSKEMILLAALLALLGEYVDAGMPLRPPRGASGRAARRQPQRRLEDAPTTGTPVALAGPAGQRWFIQ